MHADVHVLVHLPAIKAIKGETAGSLLGIGGNLSLLEASIMFLLLPHFK